MNTIEEIINRQINNWDRIRSVLGHPPGGSNAGRSESSEGLSLHQPVVGVSRELGAGARDIVRNLSKRTGYELFGYSILEKVADDIHVRRRIVDRLDERTRSEVEAFVEGVLEGHHVDRAEYLRSLLRVLRALVVQGGVILLGRGATFAVDEGLGLRVRVIAPVETRLANLMQYESIDEIEARKRIKESDGQRRKYIRKFYKQDAADPANYDLLINMARIDARTAASVILQALEPLQQ